MNNKISIAVIGGGALGLSVAYNLLGNGFKDIVLFEKNDAFGREQSGSNSGVIHAGFLYEPGSVMARFCVEGAEILYEFLKKYSVPYKRTGKLMVANNEKEERILEEYFKRARENGLRDVEVVTAKQGKKLEPCIRLRSALSIPQSGVFDPSAYVAKLHQMTASLHDTPGLLMKGCKVEGIEPKQAGFSLEVAQAGAETERWSVDCEVLINAAGLYSLDIARIINPDLPYEKQYLKGEYCQFNSRHDLFINGNIYPPPVFLELPGGGSFLDLGAHLTPKVGADGSGNTVVAKEVLAGPIFIEVSDPEDYRNSLKPSRFYTAIKNFFPSIRKDDLYHGHTGILGLVKHQSDFLIFRDNLFPNCIHLLGMESPALTASLAIGKHVADLCLSS
jgi:L-2-hydroxyglutarate oxidase LhgO